MIHQFLIDSFPEGEFTLNKQELQHLAVLRIRNGDEIQITDGLGKLAVAAVVDKEKNQFQILRHLDTKPVTPQIQVVQALAKGDRDELAIQASTELGALVFTAWQAERSISRWQGPKIEKGLARWQAIATEAMKQSHQAYLPRVSQFSTDVNFDFIGQLLVLDPDADETLVDVEIGNAVTLVVGPEGGISEAELIALEKRGGKRIRFGNSVLRTSTAAPAAISAIRTLVGWD